MNSGLMLKTFTYAYLMELINSDVATLRSSDLLTKLISEAIIISPIQHPEFRINPDNFYPCIFDGTHQLRCGHSKLNKCQATYLQNLRMLTSIYVRDVECSSSGAVRTAGNIHVDGGQGPGMPKMT